MQCEKEEESENDRTKEEIEQEEAELERYSNEISDLFRDYKFASLH